LEFPFLPRMARAVEPEVMPGRALVPAFNLNIFN
jgi:hypothetical protein